MSIGKKIKQLRELRNFTQAHMAKELGLSLGGYGKIERDETDISLSRLQKIVDVLKTDMGTILSFDSKQVFNQYNNKTATANGVVQNQQIIGDQGLDDLFRNMKEDINTLKEKIENLQKKK
jgi:transcriptional regulator with XRE-family HTH domain